jgi:hypothetical protein
MYFSIAERLSSEQSAVGAFISYIDRQGRFEQDCNGFATALVLRDLPDAPGLELIRHRALDFLESCASPCIHGAFGFWPADQRPVWAQRVPEDVDDTAVLTLELAKHGRRTLEQVQQTVYEVLMPTLVTDIDPYGPPWIRSLVFPTWLGLDGHRCNPVDCCVNTNTAALLHWCGLAHLPGYAEACEMIAAGLEWAASGPFEMRLPRLSALTPYYPNPNELLQALRHAVSCGTVELQPALEHLFVLLGGITLPPRLQEALFGLTYRGPYWRCPALNLARELARSQNSQSSRRKHEDGLVE